MKGLYIHIPFCRSRCPYCDFYSLKSDETHMDLYCDALIDEICTGRRTKEFTSDTDMRFDTVYFGGGTPSVIGAERLCRILDAIKKHYAVAENAEITAECNPSTVNDEFFSILSKGGFNRISLGLQSAVDKERRSLGRLADKNKVADVIDAARKSSIENISLDVMLGVPEQTVESLDETIDFLLSTDIPHISAYMLSIEEGTVFHKRLDSLNLPDEEAVCDMYSHLAGRLVQNGYEHYEISNFAKTGYESRHNTKYWECEEYLGIGAAAHSFINGRRFYFSADAQAFENGETAVFDDFGGDSDEYIMLGLRLKKGISANRYKVRFGSELPCSFINNADKFINSGHMTTDGNTFSLTPEGMLISNYIISNLLED